MVGKCSFTGPDNLTTWIFYIVPLIGHNRTSSQQLLSKGVFILKPTEKKLNANKTRELVFATLTFFHACGLEIQRYHLSLSDWELLEGKITPGQYKQQYSLI